MSQARCCCHFSGDWTCRGGVVVEKKPKNEKQVHMLVEVIVV